MIHYVWPLCLVPVTRRFYCHFCSQKSCRIVIKSLSSCMVGVLFHEMAKSSQNNFFFYLSN